MRLMRLKKHKISACHLGMTITNLFQDLHSPNTPME